MKAEEARKKAEHAKTVKPLLDYVIDCIFKASVRGELSITLWELVVNPTTPYSLVLDDLRELGYKVKYSPKQYAGTEEIDSGFSVDNFSIYRGKLEVWW